MAGFLWRRMFFPSQVPPNMPVGHTISLDYDTTLPGKSRITHPISPCIAVAGGRLRVGVGTQSRCARGPPGNLGELGVEFFYYTLLE